jgi:hypothetical protein
MKAAWNVVLLAALVAGCGGNSAHPLTPQVREKDFQRRLVSAADLQAPERTLIATYMKPLRLTRVRADEETTPQGVPRTVLLDEARVESTSAEGTCFGVTLRTADALDLPLGSLTFEVNGAPGVVQKESEPVRQAHRYTGMQDTMRAEGVGPLGRGGVAVQQPTEMSFGVVERRGVICAAARPTQGRLELLVRNPQGSEVGGYGAAFLWLLP